jgi:hypothetical protein
LLSLARAHLGLELRIVLSFKPLLDHSRALTVIPNVREHVSAKEISNIADEVQRLPVARLSSFKISAKHFFKDLMDKLAHIEVVEVSANEADMLSSVDHASEPIIDIDDVLDPVRLVAPAQSAAAAPAVAAGRTQQQPTSPAVVPQPSSTPVSNKQAPGTQYPPLPKLKSSSAVVQQHLSAARTSASQALADHNFCGMINPGVFCSFISLLQSWFYIKAFRNVVLKSKSQDVTLTELNCVFRSLQNRNFGIRGTDCSIEVHFLEFSVWFLCPTHIISELRFEVSMFQWVRFKESLLRS